SDGTEVFAQKYLDPQGRLECVERWGGNDGPDDAMENFAGWTLLYALGGDEKVLTLFEKAWEGHLLQFTAAKAPGIPMAENGMYWREFVTAFDWEHTGEALAAFHLYGLARPSDPLYKTRVLRFADFYTGEDPHADNYDREHKLIKSIQNGSRGAKVTPATPTDWGGLPVADHPERLTRYEEASNIKGDHPLNLCTTALGFNAFTLSGEKRFRDWTLEYAGAWRERILNNSGNIPTNIGLDGAIGGDWGQWWGGVFGWNFDPKSGSRNYFIRGPRIAFGIAAMLTGDASWMEPLRRQIQNLYFVKQEENGRTLLPRKHGPDGWYGYSANDHADVQRDIWLFSFDRTGLDGLDRDPWIRYLEGDNPDFPGEALRADLEGVRRRVAGLREDALPADVRPSDHPQRYNPAQVSSLVNLALGGNAPGGSGNILHSRLLYFDPARDRVGLPEDVAALVETITPKGLRLRLVNLSQVEPRTVVVQAGAYGEHRFGRVGKVAVNGNAFEAQLAPGSGGVLEIELAMWKNAPRYRRP
ncbi:MAG: hypothetical protein KDC27_21145, partial [Acidobacteria bacterium]|nr:hypothetical protein [Acidobacteriota bacterium]